MIKNFVLSLVAVVALSVFAVPASAQKKVDVYVGAQAVRVNPDIKQPNFKFDNTTDSVGVNGSVTGFVAKSVGVTGEVGATFDGGKYDSSLVTAMGGLTIQGRRDKTVQPFIRGLVGVARERAANEQVNPKTFLDRSDLGLAFAAGAGVDVRVGKNVALRLVQADYLQTQILGTTQHNLRVGAGIRF
jgi:hypothetical protein